MKPRAYRLRMDERSGWLERHRRFPEQCAAERDALAQRPQSEATIARQLGVTKREVRRRRELALARRRITRGRALISVDIAIALGLQPKRAR